MRMNAKVMCGKKVNPSVMTYLNSIDLRSDARKLHNVLSITKHVKRLGNLEQMVQLMGKAFAKFLRETLATEGYAEGLGLVLDYSKMTDREILEEYLKMT